MEEEAPAMSGDEQAPVKEDLAQQEAMADGDVDSVKVEAQESSAAFAAALSSPSSSPIDSPSPSAQNLSASTAIIKDDKLEWTAEEDQQLQELYSRHGRNFTKIAQELKRTPKATCARYYRLRGTAPVSLTASSSSSLYAPVIPSSASASSPSNSSSSSAVVASSSSAVAASSSSAAAVSSPLPPASEISTPIMAAATALSSVSASQASPSKLSKSSSQFTTFSLKKWPPEDDERLLQLIDTHGHNWVLISNYFDKRTAKACEARAIRLNRAKSDKAAAVSSSSKSSKESLLLLDLAASGGVDSIKEDTEMSSADLEDDDDDIGFDPKSPVRSKGNNSNNNHSSGSSKKRKSSGRSSLPSSEAAASSSSASAFLPASSAASSSSSSSFIPPAPLVMASPSEAKAPISSKRRRSSVVPSSPAAAAASSASSSSSAFESIASSSSSSSAAVRAAPETKLLQIMIPPFLNPFQESCSSSSMTGLVIACHVSNRQCSTISALKDAILNTLSGSFASIGVPMFHPISPHTIAALGYSSRTSPTVVTLIVNDEDATRLSDGDTIHLLITK